MSADHSTGSGPKLVRPYALVGGRTEAVVELAIEATVELQPSAHQQTWPSGEMTSRIIELCAEPQSVAEISAKLGIPLGVTRVLMADLVSAGHLKPRTTLSDNSSSAERRDLIERTLSGLRAL